MFELWLKTYSPNGNVPLRTFRVVVSLLAWIVFSGCVDPTLVVATEQALASPYRLFIPSVGDAGAVAGSPPELFLPLVVDYTAPPDTESFYMKTVDSNTLAVMGCGLGIRDSELPGSQDSFVILDFGNPHPDGGAWMFGYGPVSTEQIASAIQFYAWGYYSCLGEDLASHLWIGVGTNNYCGPVRNPTCAGYNVTPEHGQGWAEMVNQINDWLIVNGLFNQVSAAGANDLEVGWATPETSRGWVDGYDQSNNWQLYHFGDAAGCPPVPGGDCGTSKYPEWTEEDVWYIAWGAPPSIPTPLIYANSGIHAQQWYSLSLYSYLTHGERMDFAAAITQYKACLQRPSDLCNLLDNTPYEGWLQLFSAVHSDSRTDQTIDWSTDLQWYGEPFP
jgi:hypothetical protein